MPRVVPKSSETKVFVSKKTQAKAKQDPIRVVSSISQLLGIDMLAFGAGMAGSSAVWLHVQMAMRTASLHKETFSMPGPFIKAINHRKMLTLAMLFIVVIRDHRNTL